MKWLLAIGSFFISSSLFANVIQYFTGISYSNPAELFQVKQNEFLIGGTAFQTNATFHGSQLNLNTFQMDSGTVNFTTTSFLPYGRLAHRFSENWVVAIDVTQPFHSNLNWGDSAITRYAATQTYLTDIDVSPRASFKVRDNLFFGAGVNFNFLKLNESNWFMPISATEAANMINHTMGFGLGYDIGIYYMPNKTNFFGLVYYSKIKQRSTGYSQIQDNIVNNLIFQFNMPATTVAKYVHIFNPKWLINLQAFYVQWDANRRATFTNTASPDPTFSEFSFPMYFHPSFVFLGAVRNQFTEKLGVTLLAVQDNGPERRAYRPLNFPSDNQYFFAINFDYPITKTAQIDLLYGYGFSKTIFDKHILAGTDIIPFTIGRARLHANVVDLRLTLRA